MPAEPRRNHRLLAEKLGNCIQHIKSVGFRSFPDFMKQLFVEFPKGQGGSTDGPHQTVTQTLRSFLVWDSLKPVLDGIATNSLMAEDNNQNGMIPGYCISPEITTPSGNAFSLQSLWLWSHLNL